MNVGDMIGTYRLVEQIGRGGMGVVWRARDDKLERDVAIKIIMPSDDEVIARENAARFLLEAKAAAAIRSRHVAHVIELGLDSAGAFFVMELLHGHALSSLLARERRLSPSRAVRISSQIAVGMAAAHAIGVIHRDLKPGNIMLVSVDGEDEVVKIVDFGLAKRIDTKNEAAITEAGAVLGTLQYMSPEQLEGGAVDARSDIYALGALMYRMLTSRGPFEAASLASMIDVQLNTRPQAPSRHAAAVEPALDAIVLRCLEKDPALRFASMRELAAALAEVSRVEDAAAVNGEGAESEAWSAESGPITPRLVAETDISPPTEPLTRRARRAPRAAAISLAVAVCAFAVFFAALGNDLVAASDTRKAEVKVEQTTAPAEPPNSARGEPALTASGVEVTRTPSTVETPVEVTAEPRRRGAVKGRSSAEASTRSGFIRVHTKDAGS